MNVAMLLSCGSFEGFFGEVQGQTRQTYLESYRGDWSWYYARGLLDNDLQPVLYIPALREVGKFVTEAGVYVRFLPLAWWYRPFERVWVKRATRLTPWSLYVEELLNVLAFMRPFRKALEEDGIDLVYVQEYWGARFDEVVKNVGLPVVGADHGGKPERALKWFKRRALRQAALCFCQTRKECELISRYGATVRFQPNGCNVEEFFPDPRSHRLKSVLTIGRLMNRHKRTDDLIRALVVLPPDWRLDIVGTGPDRGKLEKLARELKVSERVTFHGFVGRCRIVELLRECGVYAMPSAHEAVAIAALEAMACGASVVLSQIAPFEELIEPGVNGQLFPVGDVERLASGIAEAWTNRDHWGNAAASTIRGRYDTRILYRELADGLREAHRRFGAPAN